MKMKIITIEKYYMDTTKTNTMMKIRAGNKEMYYIKTKDYNGFISGWEYAILKQYYLNHGHVEIEKSNMEITDYRQIENILGGE